MGILRPTTVLILVVAALATLTAPAGAHDLDDVVRESGDLPQVRRFVRLHRELDELLARYAKLEVRAGRARLGLIEAERAVADAATSVETAELRLEERINAAYRFGPVGAVEAILGASSPADVALISEYTSRTISLDGSVLREAIVARAVLLATRARSEARRAALRGRIDRLRELLGQMERKVDRAADLAVQAHLERELEAQRRAIEELAARQGSWDLGVIGYGEDQSHLLSLLGPTGGRTCETPEGLVETGKTFSGYASWYGWEFGGQPTATGAIFDPRLFTVANRWLPFGTYLRVRHGDRCAIVLVNDRGPYGRLERVIDLSMAAAQHLGVGVSWVEAEILLPSEGLPDLAVG
ncbi:MAG TPA: RlpA-like double-psi beta-barrel domain-containing protein [Actinomycetota bacterium]|jgi:hypothetical protein|nr:RlpA-like double-psi beta-barrel domain-containing protein [Actinomycetota bacterium]